jgi:hypothetical protein
MPVHEMLLESPDKDVRIASGENIGLMFETANVFLAADVRHFLLAICSTVSLFLLIL